MYSMYDNNVNDSDRSPASNVAAKKPIECFNANTESVTVKINHPFSASRFNIRGENYEDGFLKGKDAGNNDYHK